MVTPTAGGAVPWTGHPFGTLGLLYDSYDLVSVGVMEARQNGSVNLRAPNTFGAHQLEVFTIMASLMVAASEGLTC